MVKTTRFSLLAMALILAFETPVGATSLPTIPLSTVPLNYGETELNYIPSADGLKVLYVVHKIQEGYHFLQIQQYTDGAYVPELLETRKLGSENTFPIKEVAMAVNSDFTSVIYNMPIVRTQQCNYPGPESPYASYMYQTSIPESDDEFHNPVFDTSRDCSALNFLKASPDLSKVINYGTMAPSAGYCTGFTYWQPKRVYALDRSCTPDPAKVGSCLSQLSWSLDQDSNDMKDFGLYQAGPYQFLSSEDGSTSLIIGTIADACNESGCSKKANPQTAKYEAAYPNGIAILSRDFGKSHRIVNIDFKNFDITTAKILADHKTMIWGSGLSLKSHDLETDQETELKYPGMDALHLMPSGAVVYFTTTSEGNGLCKNKAIKTFYKASTAHLDQIQNLFWIKSCGFDAEFDVTPDEQRVVYLVHEDCNDLTKRRMNYYEIGPKREFRIADVPSFYHDKKMADLLRLTPDSSQALMFTEAPMLQLYDFTLRKFTHNVESDGIRLNGDLQFSKNGKAVYFRSQTGLQYFQVK